MFDPEELSYDIVKAQEGPDSYRDECGNERRRRK